MTFKTFEGFRIYHYKEILSTHTEALDLIDKGISDETIIIADKQIKGIGRNGKFWLSPEGNFFANLIINQKTNVSKITELAFVFALTVGNTLLSLVKDLNVQYKWPNDILVNSKKIGGILLGKIFDSNWLGIGIGINITFAPLPETTCISDYSESISNLDLLKELIINFNKLRQQWLFEGFCAIQEMWLKRAFKLNERISIKLAGKLFKGVFIGIDKYGKLILQQENKSLIYFNTGELFNIL